jgi:hypothetical protein
MVIDNLIYMTDMALGAVNILLDKELSEDILNQLLDIKARLIIVRLDICMKET